MATTFKSIQMASMAMMTNNTDANPTIEKRKRKALDNAMRAIVKEGKIAEAQQNKRRSMALQPMMENVLSETKDFVVFSDDLKPAFKVGEFVKVKRDTSPGMNRPDGYGWVQLAAGVGGATIVSVKMTEDGNGIHHNIPMSHVTRADLAAVFIPRGLSKRKRDTVQQPVPVTPSPQKRKTCTLGPEENLFQLLRNGAQNRKKKGWYKEMIRQERISKGECHLNGTNNKLSEHELKQLWAEFLTLEMFLKQKESGRAVEQSRSKRTGHFKATSANSKGLSKTYLFETAWGLGKMYLSRMKERAKKEDGSLPLVFPSKKKTGGGDGDGENDCVITNRALARSIYTPKELFALNYCRKKVAKFEEVSSRETHQRWYKEGRMRYVQLDQDSKLLWEQHAREHDEKQPNIKYRIVEELKRNPKISWAALEKQIGYWCSASTISRFVTSFSGYKCYCERVLPLLSETQKKSHLEFAKRFRNNWGLGGGKTLLIMYDEKWFWGLVVRRGAKACSELGIDQQYFKAYHKNHINKVMAIAFTLFAFEDSIENGGVAEKLALIRAQGFKVADKTVRQSTRDENGRLRYDGEIVRERDDVYEVDCAVTGSSEGKHNDPKCPLLPIFRETIFKQIENITAVGQRYHGYRVIFQGDNAGPHQDATFLNGVKEYCNSKQNWYWEPQAAQMPHMNVLDLSVFPCMSKRHTEASRNTGGSKVLSPDEIWENAMQVWKKLPNSKIASAYIQAYRIAGKVIKEKGDNSFCGTTGDLHCGVREDFRERKEGGLIRNDGKHIAAPNPSNNYIVVG